MSSYHLSCFTSLLGVKPIQGYEYIPLSDVDDVACRWTCWGCSRLMKIFLSFGAILLVLVHLSPTRVSHAREGNRYIHLTWYQIENYEYGSRICFDIFFLPSSRGDVDTWSRQDFLGFELVAISWNDVLPSTYRRLDAIQGSIGFHGIR